jgi:hypothetical protein
MLTIISVASWESEKDEEVGVLWRHVAREIPEVNRDIPGKRSD